MWFLGMDVGTGGTRAVIVDGAGKLMGTASSEHAPFRAEHPGWAEQDPEDWWRAAQEAIRGAMAATPEPREPIAAIALTGQMHGAVMLDETGAVLRPSLIWCDTRTQPECDWLTETDRLRAADRAHLQSGAAELYADQAAVGEDAPAGDLREDPARDVPQGLCALPADGRVCDRRAGGERNAAAGRDAPAVVARGGRGGGDRDELAAQGVRVAGDLRADQREGGGADGIEGGNAGGGGRGRPGRGRGGHGNSAAGKRVGDDRDFGGGVCGDGRADQGSEGTAAHVLPRRAGRVARDGRNAERGLEPALAARDVFCRAKATTR